MSKSVTQSKGRIHGFDGGNGGRWHVAHNGGFVRGCCGPRRWRIAEGDFATAATSASPMVCVCLSVCLALMGNECAGQKAANGPLREGNWEESQRGGSAEREQRAD